MKNLVGIVISSVYIVLILVLSKLIAKKGEEASRKFIHILLSNVWIIYYFFIDSLAVACILPIAFTIINTISYKFKILKTMEREKNDGFGTIYYAISILIITVFTYLQKNPMLGMSGMLIMGYGDGMAAVVGKKIKSKEYEVGNAVKTIAGSITMFVISFFISSLVLNLLAVEYFFFKGLVIALVATALEAISIKGLDNITVPIVVTVLTYLCI